ncbi:MAG: sigma 54-interacting transcriptional regulator [Bacteroidales bacterium]|jgi:transcriptional regulator with PAS, ATPase and Fis domain|nr:sigma 54-interacting transcriptional regulator [Bacteroidales bacterium]HOI32052.1 sigma 54-interacting transcriptional regulator [Bacteroidales bacterium]
MELQSIKQRFGIIGHDPFLERAIHVAVQVAPTDLTVLITGESGTGKEVFPKIIHQASARKHGSYIAVNCGAIPEGTIDSELFGHEKGSFTGAHEARKGYFEVVDGGTIFLDEVAELPLSTQVRLLRVLETGEFLKVGSSKVIKTDVRVVAATNVNIPEAIAKGEFRQDLYYRLNTVPIMIPPLRERKEDILMLFKKFANDFAEKYRMPPLQLTDEAVQLLEAYRWPGNIRQLKNVTEQISIIEKEKRIDAQTLKMYLPADNSNSLPVLYKGQDEKEKLSERDILYKVLFDMKKDILDLRKTMAEIITAKGIDDDFGHSNNQIIRQFADDLDEFENEHLPEIQIQQLDADRSGFQPSEVIDENLSLEKTEIDMIKRALEKHKGKRKSAAQELGISERTLYRKIKEYNINL